MKCDYCSCLTDELKIHKTKKLGVFYFCPKCYNDFTKPLDEINSRKIYGIDLD